VVIVAVPPVRDLLTKRRIPRRERRLAESPGVREASPSPDETRDAFRAFDLSFRAYAFDSHRRPPYLSQRGTESLSYRCGKCVAGSQECE
jgi:hypothetical protein